MFIKKLSVWAGLIAVLLVPARFARGAGGSDFQIAAMLLNSARSGDIATVERLVNSGADVNYVDSTGLSIVCTAIMNNDLKAAQILQVYGADASRCDAQIRRYKDKTPKDSGSGGLFSGLSNAQNMTLAAGGAALVIGGVALLGNGIFGGGGNNNNNSSSGGGTRPGSGNNGSGAGAGTVGATIAYGPAQWNFSTNKPMATFDLNSAMNIWSSSSLAPMNAQDFALMSASGRTNYLLAMGGYASLARGYTGQVTARNTVNNPLQLTALLGDGMAPIPVALITANGVNPTGTAMDQVIIYATCPNAGDPNCAQTTHRYKNIDSNGNEVAGYDFSGAGSVFNTGAANWDSMLAKMVVGGTAAGDTRMNPDFVGFMPNGQLVLYRTGGGKHFKQEVGTLNDANNNGKWDAGETITAGGTDYTITVNLDGTFSVSGLYNFNGYVGGNGHYYVDGKEYAINNGGLWELESQPYRNFEAMKDALGKSVVIANAALLDNMKANDGISIETVVASGNKSATLMNLLNRYYYDNQGNAAATDFAPQQFFSLLGGGVNGPFVVFSAGEYAYGIGAGKSLNTLTATFENAAPTAYSGLNHHFMTAVAVQYCRGSNCSNNGTSNVSTASGVPTGGKYILSQYTTLDGNMFASRACGVAGLGYGSVDPWCFASVGVKGEEAVASLAGAAGMLKGAFNYMTMDQIYTLLALTADGKYYGAKQLDGMYQLPFDWLVKLPAASDANYWTIWKKIFNETFGYGLVNLERATRPAESLYFYSGSSTKDGYWSKTPSENRAATVFNPSTAFGGRAATINTPMFDFVESADGTEKMPRVFDYAFSFGGAKYGLNLPSLLGEISFDDKQASGAKDREIEFKLSDSGTEIQSMRIGFGGDDYGFSANYRERRGDRFFKSGNPIFGLAGNAMTVDSEFRALDFGFRFSALSGSMTDEALIETDPAMSNNFSPAKLGNVYGFDSSIQYGALKLGVGYLDESDTTLGAYSGGLFDFGGGETLYANAEMKLGAFTARYTAARTRTSPGFGFISGMSDLYSDSYGVSADFGRWSVNISRPLAIVDGTLEYVQTDYELVAVAGGYDLQANPHLQTINLAPEHRETRFALLYQPEISEKTRLAFGFIERINPNNAAGHEEVLILKVRRIW